VKVSTGRGGLIFKNKLSVKIKNKN